MYGFLADATVAVHIAALIYIGFGGFVAWRWPKTIYLHVFFAAWGIAVNVFPVSCPLTVLENHFRRAQGLGDLPGGFNEYYLYDTIFPRESLPVIMAIAIAVLVISYAGVIYRWRRNKSRIRSVESPGSSIDSQLRVG